MHDIELATIDFETLPIEARPVYPPEPVGIAFNIKGGKDEYLAWGHPEGNNCTKAQARRKIKELFSKYGLVCHNGKFDLEVSEKFFGTPLVPKKGWHDTMLLAFLHNPRENNLKLKPLSDIYLKLKPQEQTKLYDWILTHVFTSLAGAKGEVKIFDTPQLKKPKGWHKIPPSKLGAFICKAPVSLAAPYAKGDTKRTWKLFKKFYADIVNRGMKEQYEIEKRVVIKSIEMEREGIMIDTKALRPALKKAEAALKDAERKVFKVIGEDVNLNSGKQIIESFESKGLVKHWEYTDKGNPKTGIDSLMRVCTNKKLVHNLNIFSKYTKIIGTYMKPWLASAEANNGLFFPWFNTIKGENDKGTYTGRFSSNFQQAPREPKKELLAIGLPHLRNFIIPDHKTHILYNRDFSSQEIRILAHFEDGQLLAEFLKNPTLDVHEFVGMIAAEISGIPYDAKRDRVLYKGCNFLIVYGGGPNALSINLKISVDEARRIFALHAEALPDVKGLRKDLEMMSRRGEYFKTAGGRWYDFEDGFEYVALNTLIQGSAADHSKRALLNIDELNKAKYSGDARLILTVHDEFMNSAPAKLKNKYMHDFMEAMEYDELFDLPMLTDGKTGKKWGSMIKFKDKR